MISSWGESPSDDCHYYYGSFDINVHETIGSRDEDNLSVNHINAIQAELSRCTSIRFGTSALHETLANKLSIAVMSFCRDLYDPMLFFLWATPKSFAVDTLDKSLMIPFALLLTF